MELTGKQGVTAVQVVVAAMHANLSVTGVIDECQFVHYGIFESSLFRIDQFLFSFLNSSIFRRTVGMIRRSW